MIDKFAKVSLPETSSSIRMGFENVKHTLNVSVNDKRKKCYNQMEVKREKLQRNLNCVEFLILLTRAVGNATVNMLKPIVEKYLFCTFFP